MNYLKISIFCALVLSCVMQTKDGEVSARLKEQENQIYFERLFDDVNAKLVAPKGKTNEALIATWYNTYTNNEKYSGALLRGWERMQADGALELIYTKCLEYAVPFEVVFLTLIESAWYPHGNNTANAAGYWQFVPATAREYGLTVNNHVDERLDMEKSTDAAIRYLAQLAKQVDNWPYEVTFNDRWLFAFAAYNRGAKRVRKTYKKCEGKYFYYPVKIDDCPESKNYVPKIFGARKWLQEHVG